MGTQGEREVLGEGNKGVGGRDVGDKEELSQFWAGGHLGGGTTERRCKGGGGSDGQGARGCRTRAHKKRPQTSLKRKVHLSRGSQQGRKQGTVRGVVGNGNVGQYGGRGGTLNERGGESDKRAKRKQEKL